MPSSTGTLVFNDQKIQAPDIYATESLGVGVSDPTSNLEVVGNAYVSSNLEVGTANLFVDTVTGRVGVGTASPGAKLDVNGYILNENPAFFAYKSGGANTTLEGIWGETSQPVFSNTLINRGSCYNTSNGRFTAPVAGVYCFHGQGLHRYTSGTGNAEMTFYKNGTNVGTRGLAYTQVVGTSDHDNLRIHAILALNANDYVQIGIYDLASGNDIYYGEYLGNFSGYLIG